MKNKTGYIKIGKMGIHISHLITICIALPFFVYILIGSIEAAVVAKNGILTKGVITRITESGSRHVKSYHYRFSYKNRYYSGKVLSISKNVGDEVVILFIKTNPSKNEVKEDLEGTYGVFLRMNPNLKNDVLK